VGIIRQLDYETAVLVAAGEMIERPASVVKELMENSIDAGATKITVEIQKGGVGLIRVSDNGCGMAKEDLPLSIKRNATSKIRTSLDISSIMTLGFRGEALASIAACAKFRIRSKRSEDEVGCELMIAPGMDGPTLTDAPMPNGTTMIVEELFANIPARRKFLRRDSSEASAVSDLFEKLAISNPGVAMNLIIDGKPKFNTPGDGDLRHAIYAIKGSEFASKLIEVNYKSDGKGLSYADLNVSVKGYIGTPENNFSVRSNQIFYVNGRCVQSGCIRAGLDAGYATYIEASKFPACVIFVEVPPEFVDVNIHPTKLEVKFASEKAMFEALYNAVRGALEVSIPVPKLNLEGKDASDVSYELLKSINAFVPLKNPGESPDPKPVYNNMRNVKSGQLSVSDVLHGDTTGGARAYEMPRSEPSGSVNDKTVCPHETRISENIQERPSLQNTSSTDNKGLREFLLVRQDTPSAPGHETQEVFLESIPPELDLAMTAEKGQPPKPQNMYLGEVPPEIEHQLSLPREKCVKPGKLLSQMTPEEFDVLRKEFEASEKAETRNLPDIPSPADFSADRAVTRERSRKKLPEYKLIGEAFLSYVFVEVGDKVMIIDKHAAHERIIFEEMRANMKNKLNDLDTPKQLLLAPLEIEFTATLADTASEYREDICAIGFEFQAENNRIILTAIPTEFDTSAAKEFFETVVDRLASGMGSAAMTRESIFEKALYQASCKAAIKIGREYDEAHLKYIIEKLLTLDDIKVCPHGRPVAFEMTKSTIEHSFKRI